MCADLYNTNFMLYTYMHLKILQVQSAWSTKLDVWNQTVNDGVAHSKI